MNTKILTALFLSLAILNIRCGRSSGEDGLDQLDDEMLTSIPLENPCMDENGFSIRSNSEMTRCGNVSDIQGAQGDFSNKDFRGIRINESGFYRARFDGSNFDRSLIVLSSFQSARFVSVKMRGVTFDRVGLADANFQDADLRGSNFINVNLLEANFKGADLRGVSFDDRTRFRWAVYDQATCLPFSEEEAQWRGLIKEISEDVQKKNCSEWNNSGK